MNIGQAIRVNRERLNLTQTELADRIGISQETIANYESGRRRPPIDTVAAMAHVFGISVDDLLGRDETNVSTNPFVNILLDLLKEKGITRNKMLTDLNLSRNSFIAWEKRGTIPSAKVMADISDYFGVSVEYLLGRETAPLALLESRSILDDGIRFEGTLSISDRNFRISLSIAPAGEERNG